MASSTESSVLSKSPTGIAGFDEITLGGLPCGRATLLVGGAGTRRLAGLHLLVAEDNPINQEVLDNLLCGEGAEVVMADNGQQVVDLVAITQRPFDAVLMDVQMPVMDGIEATRLLKRACPDLPVIGKTAHALKEEIDKCLSAGMVASVNKPIDLEILISTLLEHLPETRKTAIEPTAPKVDVPRPAEMAVIDWTEFERRYPSRPGFIDRLMQIFLQNHAQDGERLRKLSADHDLAGIEQVAHTLKGSAGELSALEVSTLAIRAMENARKSDPVAIREARNLADAVDRLSAAIGQRLAG